MTLTVDVAEPLRFHLPPGGRGGVVHVPTDPTQTIGHVVESCGIPLTEVGVLVLDGRPAPPSTRACGGDLLVLPVTPPQAAPTEPPRFLLDVHLGTLARRLRLVGVDTAWRPDADDPQLVTLANAERRVLLTRDRGLLRRRALADGAHVRATSTDEQLVEVLRRFRPRLAPWTRCPACNGLLRPADVHDIADRLRAGTRRTQTGFSRCQGCDQVYWRGAHAAPLERLVALAEAAVVDDPLP